LKLIPNTQPARPHIHEPPAQSQGFALAQAASKPDLPAGGVAAPRDNAEHGAGLLARECQLGWLR